MAHLRFLEQVLAGNLGRRWPYYCFRALLNETRCGPIFTGERRAGKAPGVTTPLLSSQLIQMKQDSCSPKCFVPCLCICLPLSSSQFFYLSFKSLFFLKIYSSKLSVKNPLNLFLYFLEYCFKYFILVTFHCDYLIFPY